MEQRNLLLIWSLIHIPSDGRADWLGNGLLCWCMASFCLIIVIISILPCRKCRIDTATSVTLRKCLLLYKKSPSMKGGRGNHQVDGPTGRPFFAIKLFCFSRHRHRSLGRPSKASNCACVVSPRLVYCNSKLPPTDCYLVWLFPSSIAP